MVFVIIAIGVGLIIAVVLAIISTYSNESVKKQARKIIESGHVLDISQARLILKVLGDRTVNNNREAEELYDGLKKLVEVTNGRK